MDEVFGIDESQQDLGRAFLEPPGLDGALVVDPAVVDEVAQLDQHVLDHCRRGFEVGLAFVVEKSEVGFCHVVLGAFEPLPR